MSTYDNPFDSGDINPFSEGAGQQKGRAAPAPAYSNLGSQFATGNFYDTTPAAIKPVALPPDSTSINVDTAAVTREAKRKEKELAAKEAALKKKEDELRRREEAVGIVYKNWPPFFPLIYHDIANDIPTDSQYLQRTAYWTWLGVMVCLVYNTFGVTVAWIGGAFSAVSGIVNLFLALMYIFVGIPLSYFLWYKRIYIAMKKDGAISFALFFLFYSLHIGFCLFASIAPPFLFRGESFTGVFTTLSMFADSRPGVGVIYAIGASFFIAETLLSIFVIQQVYMSFRGSGRASQLRGELAMQALR